MIHEYEDTALCEDRYVEYFVNARNMTIVTSYTPFVDKYELKYIKL